MGHGEFSFSLPWASEPPDFVPQGTRVGGWGRPQLYVLEGALLEAPRSVSLSESAQGT